MADILPPCIVELTEQRFRALGLAAIEESRWTPSNHPDYFLRVDPQRPEIKQRRHVHIAHKKHLTAKGKQVAWNDDATRHDKKSFDSNFKGMVAAHDIAKQALGLPPSAQLESASSVTRLELLIEEVLDEGSERTSDLLDTLVFRVADP
jgi:hypothetical protein